MTRSAVEVGACVDGEVMSADPQIHVELVGVGGAGGEIRAADDGAGVGLAEEVESAMRE